MRFNGDDAENKNGQPEIKLPNFLIGAPEEIRTPDPL